jgi:S-adenosylmethionine/arginine decarboxylase-like enzyme
MYNENFENGVYGIEAILDFHDCDTSVFTSEKLLDFVKNLIKITDMEPHGDPIIWEDHASQEPHLNGTSVFQWIKTSNIVLHTMDLTKLALLNLFSCKPFDPNVVRDYGREFFKTDMVYLKIIERGSRSE